MARTCSAYPILPLVLALLLGACGGGSADLPAVDSDAPSVTALAVGVTVSNAHIAASLYADNARTPADFYAESVSQGQQYVATSHLKNADVGAVGPVHELCTDDWSQALAWSEAAAQRSPQYSALMATDANERYYQFERSSGSQPQLTQRGRVFRCSYVDRSAVDLQQVQGQAGQLNQRPLTAAALKQLSEYLWQFTGYNNFGHAVLRSSGDTVGGELRHSLVIANLQQSSIAGGCDLITVENWSHVADGGSGQLLRGVSPLWSFAARATPAGAELCGV